MHALAGIRARTARGLPLAGVVALAAGLRIPTLAAKGYWGDEVSTVRYTHDSLGLLVHHVATLESTPPL